MDEHDPVTESEFVYRRIPRKFCDPSLPIPIQLQAFRRVFLRLHRNSRRDWTDRIEGVAVQNRPDAFLKLIEEKKTRKGDLAQAIASRIAAGDPFVVPQYLVDAIRDAAQA